MRLPSFLIVGAAKSATTSIHEYLSQNPNIYMPEHKEAKFFSAAPEKFTCLGPDIWNKTRISSTTEYSALFDNAKDDQIVGETSNDYLYYHEESIVNIKKLLGEDVKIVIILRNPIDRAFSHYIHYMKDGRENLSFMDAIKIEGERKKGNWEWGYHYTSASLYCDAVEDYLSSIENVYVDTFERFVAEPTVFLNDLTNWLGLDDFPYDISVNYNASGLPGNALLSSLYSTLRWIYEFMLKTIGERRLKSLDFFKEYVTNKFLVKQKLQDHIASNDMQKLIHFFEKDIECLKRLTRKSFSEWRYFS